MAKIARFVSFVSVNSAHLPRVALSVRYEAECENGERVLVLDDRGWSTSGGWQHVTGEEVLETTRAVVGPDEPYGGETQEDAANNHWSYIRQILAAQGIETSAAELRQLPHDVVLSEELQRRINAESSD